MKSQLLSELMEVVKAQVKENGENEVEFAKGMTDLLCDVGQLYGILIAGAIQSGNISKSKAVGFIQKNLDLARKVSFDKAEIALETKLSEMGSENLMAITTDATVTTILDAINRNGLEKVLDDLREAAPKIGITNEGVYEGMLAAIKMGRLMRKGE